MESSDAETGMVDCGVGTIVWVRRRNGSWWPGKILGPDELSASHLMSPRSGTPVKLLGREDASVDWYNLEKSKRVKPFRCGEFDDCIERAAASQGMPPKKREKYARREDAILHALELEKQLVERKYGKLGVPSNGMSTKLLGNVAKGTTAPPELSFDSVKHENSKMDLSLEDKKKGLSLQAQRVDDGTQLGIDDKSSDARPRMRGLQDLGLGPVPLKGKLSSLDASNGSHKHVSDDGIHDHLHSLKAENTIPVVSNSLLEKRKRSLEGYLEESLGKRRDRRRPLVQVLESSEKMPLINSLQLQNDGGSAPLLIPGMEQREVVDPAKGCNDVGMSVKSDDSFDYSRTFPDQVEISTSKFERRNHAFPVGLSEENTTGSTEDTETDSSGTESLISDTYDAIAALSDEGEDIELIPKSFGRPKAQGEHESLSEESDDSLTVSKWQLKGKRNSRGSLTKRKVCGQWTSFKREDDMFETSLQSHEMMNWEEGGYWEYHHGGVGGRMKSMLMDVEVQVQSGYQREHVPMISLMSKLNDKAIVGHPIPIETLEDGLSETILLSAAAADDDDDDDLFEAEESVGYDIPLQPWRTARRSAKCRVPRPPHLSSTMEDEEEEEHEYAADEERKGSSSRKGRKCPKKPQQRRSSLSCSQKTRTLASIGGRQQGEEGEDGEESEEGLGAMKATVACIPVKLVFSRLHEELVARHQ